MIIYYMDDILQLCHLIYLPSYKLKYISFCDFYIRFYNLTIINKNEIYLWFNELYDIFETNKMLLINIKSAADVLSYPINKYNINFIDKCYYINYQIIKRRKTISISLDKHLPLDIIELIYKISID